MSGKSERHIYLPQKLDIMGSIHLSVDGLSQRPVKQIPGLIVLGS